MFLLAKNVPFCHRDAAELCSAPRLAVYRKNPDNGLLLCELSWCCGVGFGGRAPQFFEIAMAFKAHQCYNEARAHSCVVFHPSLCRKVSHKQYESFKEIAEEGNEKANLL